MSAATVRPLVYATRTALAQAERLNVPRPLENLVADKISEGEIVFGGSPPGFAVVIADDYGIRAKVLEQKRPGSRKRWLVLGVSRPGVRLS